jgi:hypothetical protein
MEPLQAAMALADTIRDLGSVPSGHLCAAVMEHMDLETYRSIIDVLVKVKWVEQSNSYLDPLLTWIGPKQKES